MSQLYRNLMEPYVSDLRRMQALGKIPRELASAFKDLPEFFRPLPKPGPEDWLFTQHEYGQTLADFIQKARLPTTRSNKIYIQPLDLGIDEEMIYFLKTFAEAFFYPLEIRIMPSLSLPDLHIANRINGLRQYHAGQIVDRLQGIMPKDAHCIVGITMEDLYPRDSWNFVFGLAGERAGVFSFCRYIEGAERDLVLFRSAKVMVHEISHMFGLKHCVFYCCAMNGSMTAEEAAARPMHLCPICLQKLRHSLKFDIRSRYEALLAVCTLINHPNFLEEKQWYERRIAAMAQA